MNTQTHTKHYRVRYWAKGKSASYTTIYVEADNEEQAKQEAAKKAADCKEEISSFKEIIEW